MPCCLSGANQSDSVLVAVRIGVNDEQKDDPARTTQGMPPFLPLLDPVEPKQVVRIPPNQLSVLERNIMFGQVAACLVGIPSELRHLGQALYLWLCKYVTGRWQGTLCGAAAYAHRTERRTPVVLQGIR